MRCHSIRICTKGPAHGRRMPDVEAETPARTESILGLPRNLALRIFSALVILPPVALLLVLGGVYFTVLVAVIAGCMAWESASMVSRAERPLVAGMAAATSAVIVLASIVTAGPGQLGFVAIAGFAAVMAAASISRSPGGAWIIIGGAVTLLPCFAVLWLRAGEPHGLLLVAWLFAAVVATDVGAYAAGRLFGGPKLAPQISPNKTWSGLFGGMAASAAVGAVVAVYWAGTDPVILAATSAVLAVVAQIGDLMESAFKRKYAVKDSGSLIPGHGGVLDRLDGHMAAITFTALIVMISGQTPLLW